MSIHQAPAVTAGAASAAADETKVLDFAARLDARLADLDPDERGPFLSNLLLTWTARYERFVARVERGEEDVGGMDAFDYVACIGEINIRQGELAA